MNDYRCYGTINGKYFTATFRAKDSDEASGISKELGADSFERLIPRNYRIVIEVEGGSMEYKFGAKCMYEANEFGKRYLAGVKGNLEIKNFKIEEV